MLVWKGIMSFALTGAIRSRCVPCRISRSQHGSVALTFLRLGTLQAPSFPAFTAFSLLHDKIRLGILCRVDVAIVVAFCYQFEAGSSNDRVRNNVACPARLTDTTPWDAVRSGLESSHRGHPPRHRRAHGHGELCHGVRRVQLVGRAPASTIRYLWDAGRGGGARVWSRGVAVIAWERLVSLGLLVPAGFGAGGSRGRRRMEGWSPRCGRWM